MTNGLNVWAGYSTMYVAGYAGNIFQLFSDFYLLRAFTRNLWKNPAVLPLSATS